MSQEPTNSSNDVFLLFQPKILAAIDYIRNVNKQRTDAEAIYKYISRKEASNVNKTDIVNSIDELVKQNVVVNRKTNSGYDSFFVYNDNLVSPIPRTELTNKSTTPIITPEEPNSLTPNLTNTPAIANTTLTGSNKNFNIETLSLCNYRSAILNINSSEMYFESRNSIIGIKKLCKLRTLNTKKSNRIFY